MEACMEQACTETEGATLRTEMEAYAKAHHVPILNEHGRRFYAEFVRKQQPHRILELGTAIGYSALLALSIDGDLRNVVVFFEQDFLKIETRYFLPISFHSD